VQVAGGNTSSGSAGTVQSGPVTAGPSVTTNGAPGPGGTTLAAAGTPAAGAGTTASPAGTTASTADTTTLGERETAAVPSDQNRVPLGVSTPDRSVLGGLPVTGLGLLLFVILGLALCATGLGIRGRARACA